MSLQLSGTGIIKGFFLILCQSFSLILTSFYFLQFSCRFLLQCVNDRGMMYP